jgi:hypothetical protein
MVLGSAEDLEGRVQKTDEGFVGKRLVPNRKRSRWLGLGHGSAQQW